MAPDDLRAERDRYVAFAFAAADLLIETDMRRRVLAATGAVETLTGRNQRALLQSDLLDLIAAADRRMVYNLLERLPASGRVEPVRVRLERGSGRSSAVLLGVCRLPNIAGRLFVSLTHAGLDARRTSEPVRESQTGLRDAKSLIAASVALAADSDHGPARQVTLMHMPGLSAAGAQLPSAQARDLMAEIGAVLRARSVGGDAAARLADDTFGVVETQSQVVPLHDAIGGALRQAGLDPAAFRLTVSQVALTGADLDAHDVERAVAYAVKQFVDHPDRPLAASDIRSALTAALDRTMAQIVELRQTLAGGQIALAYQPIVALATGQVHHHEALARFADGRNVYEAITFGEEVGLIEEIDLGICRMALAALADTENPIIAVNISGRSAQAPRFCGELFKLLDSTGVRSDRIIFELTESSTIADMDGVANVLAELRRRGHAVCLDDFGAGAAAYGYLRRFEVDFVKIDGPFLRAAFDRERERALVRSICQLCTELGHHTIGEMIENQEQAAAARAMGLGFGQGWLFGRPAPLPSAPPQSDRALIRGRRRGEVEQWG